MTTTHTTEAQPRNRTGMYAISCARNYVIDLILPNLDPTQPTHHKLQPARPILHPRRVFCSPGHLWKRPQPRRAFPNRVRSGADFLPQFRERFFVMTPQWLWYGIQHYCLSDRIANLVADDQGAWLGETGEFLACFDLAVPVPLVENLYASHAN